MSTQTNYEAMSIEELMASLDITWVNSRWQAISSMIDRRRAARDAILDMAEELEAAGLVVVPKQAVDETIRDVADNVRFRLSLDPEFNIFAIPRYAIEEFVKLVPAAAPPPSRG